MDRGEAARDCQESCVRARHQTVDDDHRRQSHSRRRNPGGDRRHRPVRQSDCGLFRAHIRRARIRMPRWKAQHGSGSACGRSGARATTRDACRRDKNMGEAAFDHLTSSAHRSRPTPDFSRAPIAQIASRTASSPRQRTGERGISVQLPQGRPEPRSCVAPPSYKVHPNLNDQTESRERDFVNGLVAARAR